MNFMHKRKKHCLVKVHYLLLMHLFIQYLFTGNINAQSTGKPVVKSFQASDYQAHPQNYCAIQDHKGVLYIGNNDGLLEFDGWHWRLIKTSNESGIRCLCVDPRGMVFAGANNDFGYLKADAYGEMQYQSLRKFLPNPAIDIGIVWKTLYASGHMYFLCSEMIIDASFSGISIISAELMPQYGFTRNDTLFVFNESGVSVVLDGKLTAIPEQEYLYENNIIVPVAFGEKSTILLGDITGISINGKSTNAFSKIAEKTSIESQQFLSESTPYCATLSPQNHMYVGSLTDGIMVLNLSNGESHFLRKNDGITDQTVIGLYTDKTGNIWALLNNGINIIYTSLSLRRWQENEGVNGAVLSMAFEGQQQFVGTYTGLLERKAGAEQFKETRFGSDVCWHLMSENNQLFASIGFNILSISGGKPKVLYAGNTTYTMAFSRKFSQVLILGQDGLSLLETTDKNTAADDDDLICIEETGTSPIRRIEQDSDGNLWITSEFDGIYHVLFGESPRDYSVIHIDTSNGLPSNLNNYVHIIGRRILVGTRRGVFEIDKSTNGKYNAIRACDFAVFSDDGHNGISQLLAENENSIWALTETGIGVYRFENGRYQFYNIIPNGLLPDALRIFLHGNTLWIGSGKGLYSFQESKSSKANSFPVFIRKISTGRDSILFKGIWAANDTSEKSQIELDYRDNDISFTYAGFAYENPENNRYSYFLEGYDANWSEWTQSDEKGYTNLPEGNYIFKVRCRNNLGIISESAGISFTILSPWYRTWWAYILYVTAGIAIVFFSIRINSARLRRANLRLEQIVDERTAVIVEQKKEITDSIEYAARIQHSLTPAIRHLDTFFSDHFILQKPRNIVSGDFFWLNVAGSRMDFCVADCTGHGVPGAFMSMLGISSLNRLAGQLAEPSPENYLQALRQIIIETLHQKGRTGENADGMDVVFCSFDKETKQLLYSGANRPLWHVRKGDITEIKGDKMPAGVHAMAADKAYTQHRIQLETDDMIYLFSDGYADQFGGSENRKFSIKRLRELLGQISVHPAKKQEEILHQTFSEWMHEQPNPQQTDDVLLLGIRI